MLLQKKAALTRKRRQAALKAWETRRSNKRASKHLICFRFFNERSDDGAEQLGEGPGVHGDGIRVGRGGNQLRSV